MLKKIIFAFIKVSVLFCVLLIHVNYLFANDEGKNHYTLEELIHRALKTYDKIKIEESKIRETRELRKHLAEWFNPEIGITAAKKTSDGKVGPDWSATVTQKISFPGKKSLMEEIALIEESCAVLSFSELKLFVRYEVTRLAYEYAYHLHRKQLVADRLKRFQLIHAYMTGRIFVPPEKKIEQSIVQMRIAMLQKEIHKVDADIALVCARLNLFTGFSEHCPQIKVRWFRKPPSVAKDELLKKVHDSSYAIRLQKEALAASRKNKELEESLVYPDVGISFFYNDSRADVHERIVGGGVSFPIPLFSRNRHAIAIAEEKIKAEEQKLVMVQKQAVEEMKSLLARYEYINSLMIQFPFTEIPKLVEKMRYADAEFKKGRVPLAMYLEMDTSTHDMIEEIFNLQLQLVLVHTSIMLLAAEETLLEGDI